MPKAAHYDPILVDKVAMPPVRSGHAGWGQRERPQRSSSPCHEMGILEKGPCRAVVIGLRFKDELVGLWLRRAILRLRD